MVHFDFDDRHQDELVVGSAIPPKLRVVVSLLVHAIVVALLIVVPQLTVFELIREQQAQRLEELRRRQQERRPENRTFVFVQPRVDVEAPKPPERGESSDKDRMAANPRRPDNPTNPLPYSRGNTRERIDEPAAPPQARLRGPETQAPPAPGDPAEGRTAAEDGQRPLTQSENGLTLPPQGPTQTERRATSGALGDALRHLERYVANQTFDNPRGGADQFGTFLQFDTKGVEFGPWVRRFVAQVRRNWLPLIPQAVIAMRGHVVVQFNVHKDGRITDVTVVGPSGVDGFNHAAANALLVSNPTYPLPPEYPADRAFFTATFYYNEDPPGR